MLEAGLGLSVRIICIQELFSGRKNLAHSELNLYWPARTYDRKDNRVFITIRKDLLNTIVIKNQTDFITHSYSIVVDITEKNIYNKR